MQHRPTSSRTGQHADRGDTSPTQGGSRHDVAPGARAVHLLSGRWTLAVLGELTPGGRRYQDLHDALEHISYKVLTDTLRRAERDGLITRHLDERRVETATLYELTDLGQSLDVPLTASGATGSHRAVWVRP